LRVDQREDGFCEPETGRAFDFQGLRRRRNRIGRVLEWVGETGSSELEVETGVVDSGEREGTQEGGLSLANLRKVVKLTLKYVGVLELGAVSQEPETSSLGGLRPAR